MRRRWLLGPLILMMTIALLTTVRVCAQKAKIVFFNWYATPSANQVELDIIEAFEKSHPHIEVEKQVQSGAALMWEKALVMAAGGVPPDVVNVSLAVGLPARRSGMLLDLRPLIERDEFDMRHFRPGYELTLGPDWAWEGKIYGIPYGFGLLNVFYNREMFREAGLPEPYKGWTKPEFLTAARRLARDIDQDGNPDVFGCAAPGLHYSPWVFLDGGDYADPASGRLTVEEKEFVSALEWIVHVRTNYPVFGGSRDHFFASAMGMTFEWDSFIENLRTRDLPFEWSTTWMPRGGETPQPISYGQGHIMGIMTGSKHPEEAWEFIKFYYSPEAQQRLAQGFLFPMTMEGMKSVTRLLDFPSHLNKDEILRPYADVGLLKTAPWWVPGVTDALNKGTSRLSQLLSGAMSIPQWIEQFKIDVAAAARDL
ncbi:MAG: ABC transporter substrate-binding protein [Limnochordia bacterium]|jgi:multiple sugar transport system substrate-binding protein